MLFFVHFVFYVNYECACCLYPRRLFYKLMSLPGDSSINKDLTSYLLNINMNKLMYKHTYILHIHTYIYIHI